MANVNGLYWEEPMNVADYSLVSEPGGTIHEIKLPHNAKGIDCLEKVCSRLNLIEKDYFGLRYKNQGTNVEFWLNLRNSLADQLCGKAPFRISLCVKFFVNPQELQQQITRDLFYLTCREQLKDTKFDLSKVSHDTLAKLYSCVAQIETGEYQPESLPEYSNLFPCPTWSCEFEQMIESAHLNLEALSPDQAKIEVLHILSNLLEYGVEFFHVKSATARNTKLTLVCRRDGLRIFKEVTTNATRKAAEEKKDDKEASKSEVVFKDQKADIGDEKKSQLLQFIPYEEISTVSYKGKLFTISYGDASLHNQKKVGFKLKVQQATINLFRTFTEFHAFYQCNMVKKSVMEKCTRTSAGRVASFFRPNTSIGRTYLFDVVKTRRQTYNATWKELNAPEKRRQSLYYSSDRGLGRHYKRHQEVDQRKCHSVIMKRRILKTSYDDDDDDEDFTVTQTISSTCKRDLSDSFKVNDLAVEDLRELVRNLQDSRTCQVCMDSEVATAFCPCGHVVCCVQCSALVKECPLCRAQITYAQRVFFSCEQQMM